MPNPSLMCKKFLLTALLLLFLPASALAAKITDVWVTGVIPEGDQKEATQAQVPKDAIRWWYSKQEGAYMIFLPAGTRPDNLRIWFTGPSNVTVGGEEIQSGDVVDFLIPGKKIKLTSDKSTYVLKIMQSANVPAMFLSTSSGSVRNIHKDKDNVEKGLLIMMDASGALLYNGVLDQIKCRGNATFFYQKKPYQIKLDKSADLYGMGKAKTWILLANHYDNTLLRNRIAFDLADAVGLDHSSRSQAVDLYINSDYCGAYLLCEKVEIGGARIDINDLEKDLQKINEAPLDTFPTYGLTGYRFGKGKGYQIPNDPKDITGGYLLELDYGERYKKEAGGYATERGQAIVIKEPEHVSQAQVSYISNILQGFENAIFAKNGIDPKSGKHYSEFVDLASLTNKYLLEEVVKNYDGNRSSLFFYKPEDSISTLIMAGPAWDYDSAMGNYANERNPRMRRPEYFAINNDRGEPFYWFPALYRQPDFLTAVIKAYHADFVPALNVLLGVSESKVGTLRSLDEYAAEIEDSAAMNFIRWPIFNSDSRPIQTGRNYSENIEYLRRFFANRMVFLAENWLLK